MYRKYKILNMFKDKEWAIVFVLISLILFSVKPLFPLKYLSKYLSQMSQSQISQIDPAMRGIYVPPAQYSHVKSGQINFPNDWNTLPPDNNIPGLLPGPISGEQLGLENNPVLNLSDPIRAPLLDNQCNQNNFDNKIKKCLIAANKKATVTTMPASLYYKNRFQQCSPYNGSYCQCTNNYIPLPAVGLCQPNGWNEDVCPYRVKPATIYLETQKCLRN